MQSLGEAVREVAKRPRMHPHARHLTQAGPIRHELTVRDGQVIGRVWLGMRKYGYIEIKMFEDPRPRRRWYDFNRWSAVARYRKDRYARDIMNAVMTAWRC